MKAKIQFTPSDFRAAGQIVVRDSFTRGSKDYEFAASVAYKVGYLPQHPDQFTLTALTDGMTLVFATLDKLVDHLNTDSEGFRPLENGELLKVIETQGNRFPS